MAYSVWLERIAKRVFPLAMLLWASLGLPGCVTWRMTLVLRASADTNQGRPLQVLIRSVPVQTYRSEPYTALARLVIEPDKSVLRVLTIEPRDNYKRRLYLAVPAEVPVALYFLYESQTGSWKMLLPPRLPWSVTVPLGRKGVDVEDVRECRLGR
jgi:hypothetical protein